MFIELSFKLNVAFHQLAHSKDLVNSRSSWSKPRLILVDNMSGDCLYSMEEDLSQDSGLVACQAGMPVVSTLFLLAIFVNWDYCSLTPLSWDISIGPNGCYNTMV